MSNSRSAEASTTPLPSSTVRACSALAACADAREGRALQVRLPGDLPLLEVDAALIERVLVNLLENVGKYTPSLNAAAHPDVGQQTAKAIALYGCDATSADAEISAIARQAQWKIGDLIYDTSVDNDTKKAAKITQLAAVGIIVR